MSKILEVKNLIQEFDLTKSILQQIKLKNGRIVREKKIVHAVNNISFDVEEKEVYSLVGESGCGKSTTARTIIKLIEPKSGSITFDGRDTTNMSKEETRQFKKNIQMIFQDPYASLNPRQKVIDIIAEPILCHNIVKTKKEAEQKAVSILEKVGIRPEQSNRYPHQFSGGQRQRIGIARALSVEPKFIIADEPVSALDVSIQAQILNLLMDLQEEFGFSYLFIAHDLSVVNHISNKVGVMYLGKIIEKGSREQIFNSPKHPYTNLLLSAVPKLSGSNMTDSKKIEGEIPSPIKLPSGCLFHERCPEAKEICRMAEPPEKEIDKGHCALCHMI